MKTEMKIKPYHLRFSFVLLLMILLHFCICGVASAKKSNSMISGDQCNATIAESLADEGEGEEEFLMESETTRRFLAVNSPISYNVVKQRAAICPNCMRPYNVNKAKTCIPLNGCRQSGH